MKIMILLLLFSFELGAETIKVHVPGMVCQMCVQGMQKQFKSVVKNPETDVLVDLDKKIVTVKTKNSLSDKDIEERIRNAGYNAKKIERMIKKANKKLKKISSKKTKK